MILRRLGPASTRTLASWAWASQPHGEVAVARSQWSDRTSPDRLRKAEANVEEFWTNGQAGVAGNDDYPCPAPLPQETSAAGFTRLRPQTDMVWLQGRVTAGWVAR